MWHDKLVEMKKESKLTIPQIAEKSGVPRGTLNKIFSFKTKNPKLETINKIVNCFGYTLDDLKIENANISLVHFVDNFNNDHIEMLDSKSLHSLKFCNEFIKHKIGLEKMSLAERLKAAREYNNLQLDFVARKTCYSIDELESIERGKTPINKDEIKIFSDLYDISMEYLSGENPYIKRRTETEQKINSLTKNDDLDNKWTELITKWEEAGLTPEEVSLVAKALIKAKESSTDK